MSLTGHNMRRRLAYKKSRRATAEPIQPQVVEVEQEADEANDLPQEDEENAELIAAMSKAELVEKYDFLKMSMSKADMLEQVEAFIEG